MNQKRDILNAIHPDSHLADTCANCGHMSCEHKREEDSTVCRPVGGSACACTHYVLPEAVRLASLNDELAEHAADAEEFEEE